MTYIDLASLTWAEAARIGAQADAVGLIPVGSVEQHGPHLPLSTDSLIAADLARRVSASVVEPVVVATVMPGGLSKHHLAFPGTVDLDEAVFQGAVTAYVDAFSRMGIRKVAIFSAHGGNFDFLGRYERAQADRDDDVRLIALASLSTYLDAMFAGARRAGLEPLACDAHAGVVETSQMLAIAPELVRGFEGLTGYTAAEPGFLDQMTSNGISSLSPTGILGEPASANAVAGLEILTAISATLTRWLVAGLDLTATADVRLLGGVT